MLLGQGRAGAKPFVVDDEELHVPPLLQAPRAPGSHPADAARSGIGDATCLTRRGRDSLGRAPAPYRCLCTSCPRASAPGTIRVAGPSRLAEVVVAAA